MNSRRRVAITGVGIVSPLGKSMEELFHHLLAGDSGITSLAAWTSPELGLTSPLAATVTGIDEKSIPRKYRRTMSRVAMLSHLATEGAVQHAGISPTELANERTGVFYGSCMGGMGEIDEYYRSFLTSGSLVAGTTSTTFLKMMPQTCAANIALCWGVEGRIMACNTACASSTQAIGFGAEAIAAGLIDRALCGGAEELSPAVSSIFDVLQAVAVRDKDEPARAAKPFDRERDGIVVGEGAGTFLLEDWDTATARGATIIAEVIGFYTSCDAQHMTFPSTQGLVKAMNGALRHAHLQASDIDYINAHATGTEAGDIAESQAIAQVFGEKATTSSMKGHFGHLMGAAGIIETTAALKMLQDNILIPTRNLEHTDPRCGAIDYVMHEPRKKNMRYILKNSFAFGGVNASLIIGKV